MYENKTNKYLPANKKSSAPKNTKNRANERTGSFIGLLDGEIGDEGYKEMKKKALSS